MKKILSMLLSIIAVFSIVMPVDAASINEEDGEIVLILDDEGSAGFTYGYVLYDDNIVGYNLDNAAEKNEFFAVQNDDSGRAMQPRGAVSLHVGIEMVDSQYRMYYEINGTGLVSAGGYMKCKSTALVFPTTYHDERFINTTPGSFMTGESDLFSLPSGTEKVKVGWHDVTVRDGYGAAEPSDAYATVKVG